MTVNNFPPIISHLGTQVGKKNEFVLVIPKTSKLYYIFTGEEDTYLEQPNQFINNLNSLMAYEDIEEHITSIEKQESSITVTLNLEDIKYQTIKVGDDYNPKNPFVFEYTIGHGYVIKIEMITMTYENREKVIDLLEDTRYVAKKLKNALSEIGYKSPFYSFGYKNEKNRAHVWVNTETTSVSLTLSIYDKNVYKNYGILINSMKEKNIDKKYQILNTILK